MTSSDPPPRYRWVILSIVTVTHIIAISLIWTAVSALAPEVAGELAIPATKAVFAYSLISIMFVFLMLPGGMLADHFNVRWVVGIGALIAGIGTALRWVIPTYTGLIAGSIVAGIGMSLVNPNLIKTTTEWFPSNELGFAQGVVFAGWGVGAGLAGFLSRGMLLDIVGSWENVFLVYGVATLVVAVVWLLVVRSPTAQEQPDYISLTETGSNQDKSTTSVIRDIFSKKNTYFASLLTICGFYTGVGFIGLFPTWAVSSSFSVSSTLIGGLFFLIAAGSVLFSAVSDYIVRKSVLYLTLTGQISGVLIVGFAPSRLIFVLGAVLTSLCGGGLFGMFYVLPGDLPEITPASAGTMAGVLLSIGQIGAVVGPIIGGRLLESSGIAISAIAISLPSLVGLLAIWKLNLRSDSSPTPVNSNPSGNVVNSK
ncbi:major facilitator superfamily MFS_1 (plasmid) [Haloterrigena turkmenica DSM 5511]|uniref:Major facilitator superfamily MFS_1 n=1 Tax=Haloterrigena turkmenica (strain ATCC 51198 / DSM 5511 / JCM 9101 / NCIMB 13204 / VKM B-1734 / 4k) TaxID=543526 RepID=D2S2U9_HALTV|nr:MFS transporter [Haloterrigena turkmenica]ADB63696.1 major facilitator superfamily MFS_1 [Haloterrigena turkmenica DSM 5511]